MHVKGGSAIGRDEAGELKKESFMMNLFNDVIYLHSRMMDLSAR